MLWIVARVPGVVAKVPLLDWLPRCSDRPILIFL